MKTKHFTSVGPPSTEKTIRLPLPACRAFGLGHLRRTFDNWVTTGRCLQLLRKNADILGNSL
jgi:hypothetical protein